MTGFYRFVHFFGAPLLRLLFRVHAEGIEQIPKAAGEGKAGYLVVANHISAIDPFLISAVFPEQICYMGKQELFRIPLLSSILRGLGAYPVDRKRGGVGAVKESIRLLGTGKSVGIFPQGTRCPGKEVTETPLKTGSAMIAVRANAPVVPVYIRTKGQKSGLFRRHEIRIGAPILSETLAYDSESTGEYVRITNLIGNAIDRLRQDSVTASDG